MKDQEKIEIMKIEIGSKPLTELNAKNLMDIAKIEGVHLFFEHWGEIEFKEFDTYNFSKTYVVEFFQKRIKDDAFGKTIVFFFDLERFSFHWHFENEEKLFRESKRIKFETIKYLIKEGFDLPLY
jgi:hypothetical protein